MPEQSTNDNPFAAPHYGVPHAATGGATSPFGATTDGHGTFTVHYELQIEDVVALNLHFLKTNPHSRRTMRGLTRWLPLASALTGVAALTVLRQGDGRWYVGVGFLVLAVLLVVVMPRAVAKSAAGNVRRMLSGSKNRGVLGPCSLSIDPLAISTVGEFSESRYRWPAIERIEVADDHVLMFVSGMNCLVIPKLAFRDQAQLDSFVAAAQRYHREAQQQHA
jgi:hypothetical protein